VAVVLQALAAFEEELAAKGEASLEGFTITKEM
jgi:hypothetical protein